MERYRDIDGDSGVLAYETGPDFIRVQFKDNSVYLYTYTSAGSHNIERMKLLAAAWRRIKCIHKYERKEGICEEGAVNFRL